MKGGKKALWKDENIAGSITDHAVRFIQENSDRPFFLYFGTNDAHVPRVPHPLFRGKSRMSPRGEALDSHIDLLASFASLLQTPLPSEAAPDSQDQLAAFLGEDPKGREFLTESTGTLCILFENWKYIVPSNELAYNKLTNTKLGNSKEPQLYDLTKDKDEKKNLAPHHPEKVGALRNLLQSEKEKNNRLPKYISLRG